MPARMALDKLKNDLVVMGEMCENALDTAMMALLDRDADLAYYVIDYDKQIDEMELSLDRQCVDLMGHDNLGGEALRFVSAATKINNDLERVGDMTVEISRHVLFLIGEKSLLPRVIDFLEMANQVAQMMRESIQAVLECDITLAWKIIDERKIIDDEMQIIFRELLTIMQKEKRTAERCCHILFIVQLLGRVSQNATAIAEEVIYMEEGVIVRHHTEDFHPVTHLHADEEPREEVEQAENKLLGSLKPRDEIRREHAAAKAKVQPIPEEKVRKAAQCGQFKAKDARRKLLKIRAAASKQ